MNEHKRVKHGEQPGDVSRRRKIQMCEADHYSRSIVTDHGQCLDDDVKPFKRYLAEKGRTVQRRRDRIAIQRWLTL